MLVTTHTGWQTRVFDAFHQLNGWSIDQLPQPLLPSADT